jgi:hypothetical protein
VVRQAEQAVQPRHGAAGGALDEVVDDHEDRRAAARRGHADLGVVAAGHVLDARLAIDHPHEGLAGVERREVLAERVGGQGRGELGLQRQVDAAGEGARVRDELQRRAHAGERLADAHHLRRVPVAERVIGEQVRVPLGVVRGRDGRAAGAGAAGDAAGVERPPGEAALEQRHQREQHRAREAAGVADERPGHAGDVLRQRAAEPLEQLWRAVGLLVHGLEVR